MAQLNLGRVKGSDAEVTEDNIIQALGYTPADTNLIGLLASLTTEQKTNLVAAINEVNTDLGSHKADDVSPHPIYAKKQQMEWQTITLLNGWLGTLEYFIDEFDIVHIRGDINSGTTSYGTAIGKINSTPARPSGMVYFEGITWIGGAGNPLNIISLRVNTSGGIHIMPSSSQSNIRFNSSYDRRV